VASGKRTASERPIRVNSDQALDRAVRKIDALLDRADKLSPEERRELDRLSGVVRRYEEKHLPVPAQAPGELLQFLLEANELSVEELAGATGVAASTLAAVVAGEEALDLACARKIAQHFCLNESAFVNDRQ
jgi:antitoxin component HigA of HigAB toxin-antitoxin module